MYTCMNICITMIWTNLVFSVSNTLNTFDLKCRTCAYSFPCIDLLWSYLIITLSMLLSNRAYSEILFICWNIHVMCNTVIRIQCISYPCLCLSVDYNCANTQSSTKESDERHHEKHHLIWGSSHQSHITRFPIKGT